MVKLRWIRGHRVFLGNKHAATLAMEGALTSFLEQEPACGMDLSDGNNNCRLYGKVEETAENLFLNFEPVGLTKKEGPHLKETYPES